jgi:hypothetical protein
MQNTKDITMASDKRVLLIGPPGSGKSIMARSAPTPGFLIDTGGEATTYRGEDFDYETIPRSSLGWIKGTKILSELLKEKQPANYKPMIGKPDEIKDYKTYVLDNTTGLVEAAMERALVLDPTRDPSGGPMWNIHYKFQTQIVTGFIRKFLELPGNKIVCCHTEFKQEEGTGKMYFTPMLPGRLPDKIADSFDEVLYTSPRAGQGGVTEFLVQTVLKGHYRARSRTSGKSRELPDFIPNDWGYLTGEKKYLPKTVVQTKL